MSKMNPEVKAKWLEALRSDEYQQGLGQLRIERDHPSEIEYCCLGVLTDLAVKDGVCEWADHEAEEFLGDDVVTWAGLPESNPILQASPEEEFSLANLNDKGKSFEQIADLIEEQL